MLTNNRVFFTSQYRKESTPVIRCLGQLLFIYEGTSSVERALIHLRHISSTGPSPLNTDSILEDT
jgi:hypothetical protein